ncbi:MAG: sugar transferase [Labilithrix sp.]|nr:sugar transferase [Labilithrix sp.]MBX3221825.1 sugar transferase [Labilithrix sp.]
MWLEAPRPTRSGVLMGRRTLRAFPSTPTNQWEHRCSVAVLLMTPRAPASARAPSTGAEYRQRLKRIAPQVNVSRRTVTSPIRMARRPQPVGYAPPVRPQVAVVKRLLDVAASLGGIAVTLPLYIPIGAAIALDSPGPIFFVQHRAGRLIEEEGKPPRWDTFAMIKFRTMRVDAEKGTGAVVATKGDPRVTRVGRFLRATRLDELPQFWNVLKGDMSLVGPRPERPELLVDLAMAIPYFEERTRGIKPGLTGLAQISLGYTGAPDPNSEVATLKDTLVNPFDIEEADGALADDMRIKLMFDLAYAAALEQFWTYLRMELQILVQTPIVMLMSRGH